MFDISIDIDKLLMRAIKENGGTQETYDSINELIIEYSKASCQPEESVCLLVVDSFKSGLSKEQVEIQLKVYDSKRNKGALNDR